MNEVKVLMIDDDELIAQSTAEYFNMFGVKTSFVTSFEESVRFLENNQVLNFAKKSGKNMTCK